MGFTLKLFDWYFGAPRRALALICVACVAMLAFGMYLQHVVGLEPCPMCVVQRYALVLVARVHRAAARPAGKALRIATIADGPGRGRGRRLHGGEPELAAVVSAGGRSRAGATSTE